MLVEIPDHLIEDLAPHLYRMRAESVGLAPAGQARYDLAAFLREHPDVEIQIFQCLQGAFLASVEPPTS